MATDWIHIDTAHDMVREECAKLEAELARRTVERDEWRELCERSIAMTEEWREMATKWQQHYYALKAQQN